MSSLSAYAFVGLFLIFCSMIATQLVDTKDKSSSRQLSSVLLPPECIANEPLNFRNTLNTVYDVTNNPTEIKRFASLASAELKKKQTKKYTDGEVVDAMEQFFWGKKNGSCIELGALDGAIYSHSMTRLYEQELNWSRILIEANPSYKIRLKQMSPQAFGVSAAICAKEQKVHYTHYGNHNYAAGIIEFMDEQFFQKFHPSIYNKCIPPGNISSLDFKTIRTLKEVDCMPLHKVLSYIEAKHINYFILDVEVSTHVHHDF